MKRRRFLSWSTALAAWPARPRRARAAGAHVVVVGGGFAGTACARALRRMPQPAAVTLVEGNAVFEACPLSNQVLVGLRDPALQRFDYRQVHADGVSVTGVAAQAVDPVARSVTLADGRTLQADRLVLAPGIEFRWNAVQGYGPAAALRMPHAWQGGDQVRLLRAQLEAMPVDGLVVIAVPPGPLRCPPAPYERASLLAYWLAQHKPRARLLVLDAKDSFPQQALFQQTWQAQMGDRVRWVPISEGGAVVAVDAQAMTVETDFDHYRADVANIIPPHRAGTLAQQAGLADHSGWCPVDAVSFESKRYPGVHVIGDAALAGVVPKSAMSAVAQGRACADALAALLAGDTPRPATIANHCTALLGPARGMLLAGSYRPAGGEWHEVAGTAHAQADPPAAGDAQDSSAARRAAAELDALAGEVFR